MSKKYYFASDFHLGLGTHAESLARERKICAWLDACQKDALAIFLLGDIFEFWFEYKYTAPRGFARLMGKIAEITDKGIPVYFFKGNHDMWTFGYLAEELGVHVVETDFLELELFGKKCLIGHGDGYGKGDYVYKILKKIFRNKLFQWVFARLHPNLSFYVAKISSKNSRKYSQDKDKIFKPATELLLGYSQDTLAQKHIDYFIFGHRHLPLDLPLHGKSKYLNTGDWISYFSYVTLTENGEATLRYFENQ